MRYSIFTPPTSPRQALTEIVAGDRAPSWLKPAQLLELIAEAPGDHLTLVTWANCCGRGLSDKKVDQLLAALAADLDAAEVAR